MTIGSARSGQRQRGVALITAMLVVAVAGILAVELVWQTNLDLRRTDGLLSRDQAKQFGYGAENAAIAFIQDLGNDAIRTYSRTDEDDLCHKGMSFTLPLADEAAPEGTMTAVACDLQARFNLNNLVKATPGKDYGKKDEVAVKQFKRLLAAVDQLDDNIDLDQGQIDEIVDATVDWIDPDIAPEFNGAEDSDYTNLNPPYKAANFWFTDTSELLAVLAVKERDTAPQIYEALRPYIAALPVDGKGPTRINVNTASIPVLMSLGDDITADNAQRWVEYSKLTPFQKSSDFANQSTNFVDAVVIESYIDVTTSYFGLQGTISIGTNRLDMYSLLQRTQQSLQVRLRVFDSVEAAATNPEAVSVNDGKGTTDSDE